VFILPEENTAIFLQVFIRVKLITRKLRISYVKKYPSEYQTRDPFYEISTPITLSVPRSQAVDTLTGMADRTVWHTLAAYVYDVSKILLLEIEG